MPELCTFQSLTTQFEFSADVSAYQRSIGLIQLATDYVLENEWREHLPADVRLYTSRFLTTGTVDPLHLTDMQNSIRECVRSIVPMWPINVMAFGCTSASVLIGSDKITDLIRQERPEAITTNPWQAALRALEHHQAQRIVMLTPYTNDVNHPLYESMTEHGIDVLAFGYFNLDYDPHIPTIGGQDVENALAQLLESIDCTVDAVFISCTNMRVMHLLPYFSSRFGIPVLSSNQVMLWDALRLLESDNFSDVSSSPFPC